MLNAAWRAVVNANINDDDTPALQQTSHKAKQKHASHSHDLFTKNKKSPSVTPCESDDKDMAQQIRMYKLPGLP